DAVRTQQYNGMGDSDVICPESLPSVHIEVKVGDKVDIGKKTFDDAVSQAVRDSNGKPWALLWKPDRKVWRLSWDMGGYVATIFTDAGVRYVLAELETLSG